ncbi:MAG: bifunctional nuclease family protein [Planctomycetota bacterium]|jgi:bifunctional DNase/RNase
MEIPVELSKIVIRDGSDQQYIYVSEIDGTRGFPIIIGSYEAAEINRKVSEVKTPRPMTHDLIRLVLQAFEAKLEKIVVNDLSEGTFYANLHLQQGDQFYRIDCRPSDAIALASALKAPIYVEESVMEQVGKLDENEGL